MFYLSYLVDDSAGAPPGWKVHRATEPFGTRDAALEQARMLLAGTGVSDLLLYGPGDTLLAHGFQIVMELGLRRPLSA